jgi:nicotinate-nucleotide pyrophosphorylase (carboxylating)
VSELSELVALALGEDVGDGDLTAEAVVPDEALAVGTIEQRAPGVIFGLDAAAEAFSQAGAPGFEPLTAQGEWREGGEVARVEGPARAILAAERVALNLLGRLSGTATLTARYVAAVEGTGVRILDTRKTTPGLRALERSAVVAGGGASHRAGLYDAILVKENHAALAGGVGEAARLAMAKRAGAAFVEVEVETLEELDLALEAGVERILLDNMGVAQLREAVARAGVRAELEASGGITLDNVREVAETGVNFISVGALTHSAPALDLSLLLAPR